MNNVITAGAVRDINLGQGGSYGVDRDVLNHRIWDSRYFTSAVTSAEMFQQPIGAQWRAGVKTVNETNLYDSGKMPQSQTFLVKKMGVALCTNGATAVDMLTSTLAAFATVMQKSVFEIVVRGREFDFQVPGAAFIPLQQQVISPAAPQIAGGVLFASGFVAIEPTPIFLDNLVSFTVRHRVQAATAYWTGTALAGAYSALAGTYSTLVVILEGTLTRGK